MVIREAKAIDATSIARVDVDSWQTTYTGIVPQDYLNSRSYEQRTSVWQTRISDSTKLWPRWFVYVAEDDDGSIIGFAGKGRFHSSRFPQCAGSNDKILCRAVACGIRSSCSH